MVSCGHLPYRVARIPVIALIWVGLTTVWGTMLYVCRQTVWLVLVAMGLLFMATNLVDDSGWGILVIVVAVDVDHRGPKLGTDVTKLTSERHNFVIAPGLTHLQIHSNC